MIVLENEHLKASFSAKGAELQALLHSNGISYLWGGDARWWGKHSPVLFPVVGSLRNDSYRYQGKTYRLPRHGFARDREFTFESLSAAEGVFTLSSDEETLQVYPFPFILQLHYLLDQHTLFCTYRVLNTGTDTLYFSVGGHPAFAVPLEPGLAYQDYYLQFEREEPLLRYKLQDGLISEVTERVEAPGGYLPLKPELFYEDAIVLKHLQSRLVSLRSERSEHGLNFDFGGFPYLGIWAARDAPFVCIEPWCGHADTVAHNQELTQKPGMESLEAGGRWERTWSMTCF
ncbi:MAG: aldose 1-epimerase family protein [Chitinophagaceae bacterium]|jgi:galactose mutarotase-like enzyme|nr:aldose 1-epimerase family protein [Chitinophagaceae bacterium]